MKIAQLIYRLTNDAAFASLLQNDFDRTLAAESATLTLEDRRVLRMAMSAAPNSTASLTAQQPTEEPFFATWA
jgi:hypothetical protein